MIYYCNLSLIYIVTAKYILSFSLSLVKKFLISFFEKQFLSLILINFYTYSKQHLLSYHLSRLLSNFLNFFYHFYIILIVHLKLILLIRYRFCSNKIYINIFIVSCQGLLSFLFFISYIILFSTIAKLLSSSPAVLLSLFFVVINDILTCLVFYHDFFSTNKLIV